MAKHSGTKQQCIHVIPHTDGWAVKSDTHKRNTSVHHTQQEAIVAARKYARAKKGELVIHAKNGEIRERKNYGAEPLPQKKWRVVLFPRLSSKKREQEIRNAVLEVIKEIEGKPLLN